MSVSLGHIWTHSFIEWSPHCQGQKSLTLQYSVEGKAKYAWQEFLLHALCRESCKVGTCHLK